MVDSGNAYKDNQFKNAFAVKNMPTEIVQVNKALKAGKYDAILPLPFFLVGPKFIIALLIRSTSIFMRSFHL